ncbi:hypothetical protein Ptr902_08516 [Pyrenophora tritici-repentis]|nr:hypothetical protein Ptr902_08516 [Pyrenophora tritici-repentis]
MAFDLQNINANPIRWYHGSLDLNTSADAVKATADLVNLRKTNIEFLEVPGLDHITLQTKMAWEAIGWLQK